MATLRDIRRRIRGVHKTQQITSAMRMVAAAKLRRAQDSILAARPYARHMYATLAEIGRREAAAAEHPLLRAHPRRETLEVVVITSDRGLCGAFNGNAIKRATALLAEQSASYGTLQVSTVGRKADEHFRRRRALVTSWTGLGGVEYRHAVAIAEHISKRYLAGESDGAVLVFNEFVSAINQKPSVLQLLPLAPEAELASAGAAPPYEMEPNATALLNVLVPNALEFTIYAALLENQAGEYAARMTAMESATRNTEELISSLTLQFNRARQAAITRELVEIVSGAEALH